MVPLVYRELRRQAHRYLRQELPGQTLQTTALVHEAYLRLNGQRPTHYENRAHFFALSAHLMRQILVEEARKKQTLKRNGGYKLALEDAAGVVKRRGLDLIALDDALNSLARLDPQQSHIVVLRFFGGFSIEETSQVLGISPSTVKRDWATARVWLQREMDAAENLDA